jgi:hypothetical protein
MMALYCRHLSASTTLNVLPPEGPAMSHVTIVLDTEIAVASQTGRYFATDTSYQFKGHSRNLGLPPSDLVDALSCPVNLSWIDETDAAATRPQDTPTIITPRSDNRLGGPYFTKNPIVQSARDQDPINGYKAIIGTSYHSQTPLRSTIPDA